MRGLAIIFGLAFSFISAVRGAAADEERRAAASAVFACEILGICDSPESRYGWWDARGEPLEEAPEAKAAKPGLGKSIPVQPDQMKRLILLRARALRGALVQVKIEGDKLSVRLPEAAEGPTVVYSLGHVLVLPETQESISFRVGVASGEWKTAAVRPRRPDEGNVLQFDLAEFTDDGVQAFDPQTQHTDVRVLAEDDEGALHPSQGGLRLTAEGTVMKLGARFDVPAARIRNFHLQTRPLHWIEFRDVTLQPSTLPEAERIRLAGGEWTAEGDGPHAKLRWYNVADGALERLAKIEGLRELDLAGPHLTNRGVERLADLAELEQLRIVGSKINGDALEDIARLENLCSLELSGSWLKEATAEQLAPLAGLKKLQRLKLWDVPLTDDGMAIIAQLPQLRGFYGDGAKVTESGLAHFARHPHLETLDLNETDAADAALAHLATCTKLQRLDVSSPKFTDAGLRHVALIDGLERLDLRGGQITDAGLQHLADMKNLDLLDLRGTQVTRDGWRRLRETAPEVRCYLPEPERSPTVTLRGRVVNAADEPIADADVYCFTSDNPYAGGGVAWGPGPPRTPIAEGRSDSEGRLDLVLPRARVEQHQTLWAVASDGRSGSTILWGNLASNDEHTIRIGDDRIAFRVLYADGRPAAGVRVMPLQLAQEGRNLRYDVPPSLLQRVAQVTDAGGRASVISYPAERLRNVGFASPEVGMQSTSYAIAKHADKKGEIVVLLAPASRIKGRIIAPQETDFSAVEFTIYNHTRLDREHPKADITELYGSAVVRPDAEGRFTVPAMPPGWLRFLDRTPAGAPVQLRFPDKAKVEPGEPFQLDIAAVDTVLLRGSVLLSDSDDGAADFELRVSHGRTGQSWTNAAAVHTDRCGRFEVRVIPGEVRIYCVSIHRGYRDVELWKWRGGRVGGYHHVPAGVEAYEAPAIVLVPEVKGAGRLVNAAGEPLKGWSIYGYPSEKPRDEVTNCFAGRTDSKGEFTFAYPGTHPPQSYAAYKDGDYHAVAVQSADPLVLELGPELGNELD
ncbi:MAG: hypothetical protein KY475_02900 [Planctomycetes bacterium]|nr:hypothetical protein [Planctomycetota bacterium]